MLIKIALLVHTLLILSDIYVAVNKLSRLHDMVILIRLLKIGMACVMFVYNPFGIAYTVFLSLATLMDVMSMGYTFAIMYDKIRDNEQ